MINILNRDKVVNVMKWNYRSYLFPRMLYLVAYEDGSYTLLEGDNLDYLYGKKRFDIKRQVSKFEDIKTYGDSREEWRNYFYAAVSDYEMKLRKSNSTTCEKLGIRDSFIDAYYVHPGDQNYAKLVSDLKSTLSLFMVVCKKHGIKYETNSLTLIRNAITKINDREEKFPDFIKRDISFCYSIDSIKERFQSDFGKAKSVRDLDNLIRDYKTMKQKMLTYTAEYFSLNVTAVYALTHKVPNYKNVLKSYTEFLISLLDYVNLISYMERCIYECEKKIDEIKLNKFNSNTEFINDLNDVISHDTDTHEFLYHVTQDEATAQQILREGLYMFSPDLGSTTLPELSANHLLVHGYGNSFKMFQDFIIIIDWPNDEEIVRELSEDERSGVMIMPRRMAMMEKPRYVVDPKYIVGYIDKKNMKIVRNENRMSMKK